MVIGIMGALHEELAGMLEAMPDERRQQVAGRTFWCGRWQGQEVVAVLSRVGKVAAATTATALIERFGVNQIVFTGVAGGIGQEVRVGDVVVANGFVQHDMDASPLFARHEVPLYGRTVFETDVALSSQLAHAARDVLADVGQHVQAQSVQAFALQCAQCHQGLVATGDRFVSSSAECRALQQALPQALAVEMEGAAVAQVCFDYGVPFAALRTISDRADDDAH
ncbi:MAG: 5-methylthioadenosine/S-adenosylhomocysteine nucleosidase, partial [Pseudomonadota bacterium]